MTTSNTLRSIILLVIMLLAAFTRLVPHPANFTAVMAVALFGGAKFRNPFLAIATPLSVMLITDLFIGFHSLMPLVYLCIAVTALIGIYIGEKSNPVNIISASVISSTLFFLVTNAGVWFQNPQFTQDVPGLMSCYVVALPFYGNQLLGDVFFNGILFGVFALAHKRVFAFSR